MGSDLRLMLAAMAGMSLGNFAVFSSPIYIGSLVDGLGFGEGLAGITSTAEISAVAAACLLLSGRLDRISLQKTALTGLTLVVLANSATLLASKPCHMILVRVAAGAGAGLCLSVTSAVVAKTKDPDKTVGLLLVINALIMVVILAFMGYAKSRWQFHGYATVFLLFALILLPCVLLLPDSRDSNSSASSASGADNVTSIGHNSLGLLGLLLFFLFCIQEGTIWAFSERSGTNLGITDTNIGFSLALGQVAGLAGATTASIVGSGTRRMYPICFGNLLMGIAGLLIYQTGSPVVYAASLCMFSYGFFLGFPYIVGAFAKLDEGGSWVARANGLNLLGASIAPLLGATIVSFNGYHTLGYVCLTLAAITVSLALAFSWKVDALESLRCASKK